jgi:hypothetical protein
MTTVVGMRVHRLEMYLRQEVKRAVEKWSPQRQVKELHDNQVMVFGLDVGTVYCMMRTNGYWIMSHEWILDYVSRCRKRIRSHIVKRLPSVISMKRFHNLLQQQGL